MSNNEHSVSPAGLGNEPPTTNQQNPSPAAADNANVAAQHQNLEQKTENVVTDTKSAEGGENTGPAPSTTTNDTTAAASTNATQTTSEEPKEPLSESSAAQAKEVEAPKEEQEEDSGPSLVITLLLTSGSRHPFKIDGKYLRRQSVNIENNDPFAMSVYTLKELIWREWRSGKDVLWEHVWLAGMLEFNMDNVTNNMQTGNRVRRRLARSDWSRSENCLKIRRLYQVCIFINHLRGFGNCVLTRIRLEI